MPGSVATGGAGDGDPAAAAGLGMGGGAVDDMFLSFSCISGDILGGATGFSSSSSTMLPFASRWTHRPSVSSNAKDDSSRMCAR